MKMEKQNNSRFSNPANISSAVQSGKAPANDRIEINALCKSYNSEHVLNQLSLSLSMGKTYCLMAPSGTGKTTLFRILMGLEQADSGQIHGLDGLRIAAVFQEDRLLEGYTALENLRFVTGKQYSNAELTAALLRLLPGETLTKPICEFSGGMKRRTAILRAILAPSDFIIMDEPFTGLDAETRQKAIDLIKEYAAGKLFLISTHHAEDAKLLSAEIVSLPKPTENLSGTKYMS